jgi:hypothetical protein
MGLMRACLACLQFVDAISGKTFVTLDPRTGEVEGGKGSNRGHVLSLRACWRAENDL